MMCYSYVQFQSFNVRKKPLLL